MNSDTPQPGPPPARLTPPRTSNLKGRWKRGPGPATGTAAARPTTPASCGEVTDVTSAKESLSGEHIKGYEHPVPVIPSNLTAVSTPAPAAPPQAQASPRTEAAAPRPPGPITLTPRPGTFNPPPPPRRHSPQAPSAEYLALREAQRAEAQQNPRPAQSARPSQQPRPPQDSRGGQQENRGGERANFVALKPDPANDPAPRRLRTEASRPVPVEEYSPSNFSRGPDKSIPSKHEHHEHRDRPSGKRESVPLPSSERPKPHTTIPARVSSSKEGKVKAGGIMGFIKKIFGNSKKDSSDAKRSSSRHEPERESKDGEGGEAADEEPQRRRGGPERHGEHRHRSHRRSERR